MYRRLHARFARYNACLATLLIPILTWQSTTLAETTDLIPVVQKAIKKLDATNLDNDWYFAMEVIEGDEVQIIHNDPRRGKYEKRELISVNGIAPDSKRQAKFRETEEDRVDELDPDAPGYGYLVDVATLQLIQTSDSAAKFSFQPKIKAMEDARDQLRGTLLLNLETGQIGEIEISNTEKLSPAFSVTVDTYRLVLKFQPEQGEVVLNKLDSQAIGSAGFLKSFENVVFVTFSDYKRSTP